MVNMDKDTNVIEVFVDGTLNASADLRDDILLGDSQGTNFFWYWLE